jgi:fructuronate reductase
MVDSITPATSDETVQLVARATGASDAAPIQREPFTQWIIEEIPGVTLPPWDTAGAQFVPDVRPFETAKHRILHGLHTSASFLGLYAGLETVEQAIKHRHIRRFLERLCVDEIIPTLPACPSMDLNSYSADVFGRLENPGLRHELQQITWDTSKKLPYRIFSSLISNMEASRPVDGLSTVLAMWLVVIHRRICDEKDVIDPLSSSLSEYLAPPLALTSDTVAEILNLCELPTDTARYSKLTHDVSNLVREIGNSHPEAFLESLAIHSLEVSTGC